MDAARITMDKIGRRRAQTLNMIVREGIEHMIINGDLEAGQRINESNLATALEVSRGPVREACRSLEQAGLLVSAVNHGVYVREITLEEARDLYEVRGALAGLAGRLIVQKAGPEQIDNLEKLIDRMGAAEAHRDFFTYYGLNIEFHDALVETAGNPALEQSYKSTIKQLHLFRRKGLVQVGNMRISNEEHQEILDAVKARDEKAAEAAMRKHVAGGWARISAFV